MVLVGYKIKKRQVIHNSIPTPNGSLTTSNTEAEETKIAKKLCKSHALQRLQRKRQKYKKRYLNSRKKSHCRLPYCKRSECE